MKIFKIIIINLVLIAANLFAQDENKKAKTSYEITFTVNGMTCEGCVEHVQETLKAVNGVTGYDVKRKENLAVVEFDPKVTNAVKIEEALKKTNFEIKKQAKDEKQDEQK
ncbi:MAG: heavy-metal-associated domain-containing protein [Calditrichaeota bacterium]|nr:MAG: heavy-metal-associated domain-containing protein [Calditrichota bacterium]MBL1207208.1 heavy-metal-associated domain-containing protein [Calditrichota bacterium]NOG47041.1 heavy-metal-associated domain-containing protein [Calditrichota bacterium]